MREEGQMLGGNGTTRTLHGGASLLTYEVGQALYTDQHHHLLFSLFNASQESAGRIEPR